MPDGLPRRNNCTFAFCSPEVEAISFVGPRPRVSPYFKNASISSSTRS